MLILVGTLNFIYLGAGVIQCGQCLGTGMNPDNLMKKAEDQLVRTQGVNPFAFEKNAPCWLCRCPLLFYPRSSVDPIEIIEITCVKDINRISREVFTV